MKINYKGFYLAVILVGLILFLLKLLGNIVGGNKATVLSVSLLLVICGLVAWIVDARIDVVEAIKICEKRIKKQESEKFAKYKLVTFVVFILLGILTLVISYFYL
ncbi:MAG: hypothetical protein ABIG93_05635 [archaeon]|nr:hypothetical protein [Nanoarchaeota archaeon]